MSYSNSSTPSFTAPQGFRFAGLRCGIKPGRADLGVILSTPPAVAAGVFTQNPMAAACVGRNATLVPAAAVAAVVVNSGNANAMTGTLGVQANEQVAQAMARQLGVEAAAVLTASTGVIGVPLPADLICEALPQLSAGVGEDPTSFAQAILTTDTVTKLHRVEVLLPGDKTPVRLLGVAKGSGMIHPNMATTLGFVCTDAAIAPGLQQELLRELIATTFNAITVDGDTSTNDMVLLLANGSSGNYVEGDVRIAAFRAALHEVLLNLAKQVARDGEGATRLLQVEVCGAPSVDAARAVARTVAKSSLVKCSAFAGRPEWGRIAMAVGQAALENGFAAVPQELKIFVQGSVVYDGTGGAVEVQPDELKRKLREADVRWVVDLGQGEGRYTAYGCDLSYDYVRINADDTHGIDVDANGKISRNLSLAAYSPRLKQQLLVEGLGYVRRFSGVRMMVYLQPAANIRGDHLAGLAQDLELCLDAGLKPLAVVPDDEAAELIAEHIRAAGHYVATVAPDALSIVRLFDRGHLGLLVRPKSDPEAIVDLAVKTGIQKLVALGTDQGLRDGHGLVSRLSPDTLLDGVQRGRFERSDPDLVVLARHVALRGVPALHILDARMPHAVVGELFTDQGVGTLITRLAMP